MIQKRCRTGNQRRLAVRLKLNKERGKRSLAFGFRLRSKLWFCYLAALWPKARFLTSLILSFFMHKMGKWHLLYRTAEMNDEIIERFRRVSGTELNKGPIRHKFCQIFIRRFLLKALVMVKSNNTYENTFLKWVIFKCLFFLFSSREISLFELKEHRRNSFTSS